MPSPMPADRIAAIDIVRGVALFGVMAINLVFEFRVSIFDQFLPPHGNPSVLDKAVASILSQAIEMKAFALFSLLFGVGLAIQFDRLAGKARAALLTRRLLVLLAFGVVHMTLIWNGDILTEYALAGLLVLPLLYAPRWLLLACSLALLGVYATGLMARLAPFPDQMWLARHVMAAQRAYSTGTFAEVLSFRLTELQVIAPLHAWVFARTLALFMFGTLIWRSGALQRGSSNPALCWLTAAAAFALTFVVTADLATVTLALAYGSLIFGLACTALGARLLAWAAPLGRMAFTNYVMQSIVFGFVFYGHGLGLFGQLPVSTALGFGIVVYALQAMLSTWWLGRFSYGPLEWLWRTLMYGRRQPMRLDRPATTAGS